MQNINLNYQEVKDFTDKLIAVYTTIENAEDKSSFNEDFVIALTKAVNGLDKLINFL